MTTVAIVGGGITGLTAAFYLQRQNVPVTVYESAAQPGGAIQTTIRDGFLVEHGPNTILESAPEVSALVDDLGLNSRRLYPAPGSKARYLVRDGAMIRLPQSALGGVRTPLLSLRAKLRILAEPFIAKGRVPDEALADFVKRRLGTEVLDYCIDPFVGGVYAGNPERLSVAHGFPKLHALEQTYGSLIKGTILGARARRKRGSRSKTSSPMLSFDAGLGVLIETLAQKLGDSVQLQSLITHMERDGAGWTARTSAGERRKHSAVLLCAPAWRVAAMNIERVQQPDLARLRHVYYPPIARVAVAFPRNRIAHALDGFGVLIPSKEKMHSLGILFSSSLFPNRAPEGYAVLTSFLGGSRWPGVLDTTDKGLVEIAIADMRKLLGVSGSPVFEDVLRVPFAIPQYNIGYGEVKTALGNIEAQAPGVFVSSSFRNGISVADCIVSGKTAAEKLVQYAGHA